MMKLADCDSARNLCNVIIRVQLLESLVVTIHGSQFHTLHQLAATFENVGNEISSKVLKSTRVNVKIFKIKILR